MCMRSTLSVALAVPLVSGHKDGGRVGGDPTVPSLVRALSAPTTTPKLPLNYP